MKKDHSRTVPLAFNEDGDPIPVPLEAHFFRLKVRRGNAKRPRLLCSKAGQPVLLPIDTQPEDFQEQVGPGIYRLEPVDADGYSLQDAPTFKYTIEREDEEEDPSASRGEAFVSKILKENRQLVNRIFDHIEQQSEEQATRMEGEAKRAAEHVRLLSVQAERFEKATTSLAEQNAKATAAMLAENVKLVTVIANKFGDYISEATNLLAAHPAAGKSPTAADIVSEHKQIRNAVADLAEAAPDDNDNPLLSLLDKSLDSALPVLAPALQRVIHRVFGLSQKQSNELTGAPTQPVLAQGSAPIETPQPPRNGKPTSTELARVMEVLNQLSEPERAAAMAAQQAMSAEERDRLRAELVALPTADAAARVRQLLAERRGGRGASGAQAHLQAVLALLAEDEKDATQELLDALPAEQRTRWRAQILSRSPIDAAALIRAQLTELAAAIPLHAEAVEVDGEQEHESDDTQK